MIGLRLKLPLLIGATIGLALIGQRASATVIVFDGDAMPEELGWERGGTMDAERSLENGWYVQSMDLGNHGPPPYGESDWYRLSLAGFAGSSQFVAEWRVETDGPSSEFTGVAPAALVLAGNTDVFYHFTIAKDRVRLIRDFGGVAQYFDYAPDLPHTFRVELFDDDWYRILIDGGVIDEGVPGGPYPDDEAYVAFGGGYYENHNTNRWDYIHIQGTPEPSGVALLLVGAACVGRRKTQLRSRR